MGFLAWLGFFICFRKLPKLSQAEIFLALSARDAFATEKCFWLSRGQLNNDNIVFSPKHNSISEGFI